jgi:hypothetical protein
LAELRSEPWDDHWDGLLKKKESTGYQWLTLVILATQETEIRRIEFQSHSQANSSQDPISKMSITKEAWKNGSSDRVPT